MNLTLDPDEYAALRRVLTALGGGVMVTGQSAEQPQCEHRFAWHSHAGMSVRLCQFCGEPDWQALRAEVAEAVAAERERVCRLAAEHQAVYIQDGHARPFADLLREHS